MYVTTNIVAICTEQIRTVRVGWYLLTQKKIGVRIGYHKLGDAARGTKRLVHTGSYDSFGSRAKSVRYSHNYEGRQSFIS